MTQLTEKLYSAETQSLSAPLVTAQERQKSSSKFYDLTNFYQGYTKFLSESDLEQLTGFDNIRLREDLPGCLVPNDDEAPDPKNDIIGWDDKFTQGSPPSQKELEDAWNKVIDADGEGG
jgi:hypothetical protein